MKKTGIFLLIIIIAALTSCSGMMGETDDITIDLSALTSKAPGVTDEARIWLAADGTSTFYPLGNQHQQTITGGIVTLEKIPAGPVYNLYISVDNDYSGSFVTDKSVSGQITVSGGATTSESFKALAVKTTGFTALAGKSLNGVAYTNSRVYTVDDSNLYWVNSDGTGYGTEAVTGTYTFNDISAGMDNTAIISMSASDGEGFSSVTTAPAVDYSFADTMPAALASPDINILSTDVFFESDENIQLVIGHTAGGMIINMKIDEDDNGSFEIDEWFPVDLKPFMDEAGISLAGTLIRGLTVVKKYDTSSELDALWIYMLSKAGNFRIVIPLSDDAGEGLEIADGDAVLELFNDFVTGYATPMAERVLLNISNPAGDELLIGTDNGLFSTTAVAPESMTYTKIAGDGERIELLESNGTYTACVTALKLILVKKDGTAYTTAELNFNEGLPVNGLLNEGGVSGMAWNGNVLYVTGENGLVSLAMSELTFE